MARLTLATLGVGIVLAWASLAVCALVLRVPLTKSREPASGAVVSPALRYRTLVVALLGAAAVLVLPSLREGSRTILASGSEPWHWAWPDAAPVRAAVDGMRPWAGRFAVLWCGVVAVSWARA